MATVPETQAQHGSQELLRFWVSFQARALAPPGQEGRERHQENVAQPPNGARGRWINFQRIPWNLTHHPVCAVKVASRNFLTGADPSLLARRDADACLPRFAIWTAVPGQEGRTERHQEILRSLLLARRGGGSNTKENFSFEFDPPPRLAR